MIAGIPLSPVEAESQTPAEQEQRAEAAKMRQGNPVAKSSQGNPGRLESQQPKNQRQQS